MDEAGARPAARQPIDLDPADFLAQVEAAGVRFGDQPLCRFLRPLVVSSEHVRRTRHVVEAFHVAVRAARAAIVADGLDGRPGSLALQLGVDPRVIQLARADPGYASAAVIARIDTFCPDDQLWMLELNAESPAGIGYSDALCRLFLELGLAPQGTQPRFAVPTVIDGILEAWQEWSGGERPPSVGIVDLLPVQTRPEFDLMAAAFRARGLSCEVHDLRALRFDGERLWAGERPIDLVYRRLLVEDLLAHPREGAALVAAAEANRICMVNSFRAGLLHTKGLFALLTAPRFQRGLPAEVQAVLRAHVPETLILSNSEDWLSPPGIRERVRRSPEDWVIKPYSGHGGRGVVVGELVDRRTWERAGHVAQRRVPERREDFPEAVAGLPERTMQVSFDPFLVMGRLAGFLCRLSHDGPGNVSQGASQVPVFVAPDGDRLHPSHPLERP